MTRRWPVVGVALAALWLFVRGVTITPTRIVAEGLTGLAIGLPLAYLLRRFYRPEIELGRAIRAIPIAVVYVVFFVKEVITANIDVVYRVLAPSLPINPDVVEIPLRVESDLAVTTIANSITLTPGTLTMDHDAETNTLYVHAISAEDRESIVAPIRRWEDYALRIFPEDASPSDPAPSPSQRRAAVDDTADEQREGES